MKKIVLAALLIAGAGMATARAEVSFRVGISIGDRGFRPAAQVIVAPPVVCAPAPVVVAAPPVCAPAPVVIYQPAPAFGYYRRYEARGWHEEYHRREAHGREWDRREGGRYARR